MCDYIACARYIKEILLDHFQQEGRRFFYTTNKPIPLGTAFYKDETGEREFDINITKRPEFKISNLVFLLEDLYMDININMGPVVLEGKFLEVAEHSSPLQGNVVVTYNDMCMQGKVAFFTNEDSFYPENVDLEYKCASVTIETIRNPETRETKETNIQTSPAKEFWPLLTNKLNEFFWRQLMSVIVEYSVQESLCDEDKNYKLYCKVKADNNNKVINDLLKKVSLTWQNNNENTLATSDFIKVVKNPQGELGKFIGTGGLLKDLSTIEIGNKFSLIKTGGENFKVVGKLVFSELEHEFSNFAYKHAGTEIKGKSSSNIKYGTRFNIVIAFTKTENGYQGAVEKKTNASLGEVDTDISDNLMDFADVLPSIMRAYYFQEVLPAIQNKIFTTLDRILQEEPNVAEELLKEDVKLE